MAYSIIQPPFTLKFREMPKAELKECFQWFMRIIPERLAELSAAVRETRPTWAGDFSLESLEELSTWFEGQVDSRPKTQAEVDELTAKLTFPIDVSGNELTNRTFSLAMDIGIYLSQVVINNLDGARWDQPLKNEKFADYGQPVIMGFGTVPMNPVRLVVVAAYGVAKGKKAQFRELYGTWAKMKKH